MTPNYPPDQKMSLLQIFKLMASGEKFDGLAFAAIGADVRAGLQRGEGNR